LKNFCELHNLKKTLEEEEKKATKQSLGKITRIYFLTNANILFLYNIFGSINRYLKKKFDTIFYKKKL